MRCLNCGEREIASDINSCPNCGALFEVLYRDYLKPGHLLNGESYEIEEGIGRGGFGITYIAQARGFERQSGDQRIFSSRLCDA